MMVAIASATSDFVAPTGDSYDLATDAYRFSAAGIALAFGGTSQTYTVAISGIAQGNAFIGVYLLGSSNSSTLTINASGFVKGGTGIYASHASSTIVNHGTVVGGSAIARDTTGGALDVTNTGFLVGDSTLGAYATLAISGNAAFSLTNSGLVRASGSAAIVSYGASIDQIENTGRIMGSISLGNGDGDYVLNSGVILGTVSLGAGNDTYNGTGSSGIHTVNGGTGSDSYTVKTGDIIIEDMTGGADDDVTATSNYVLGGGVYVETLRVAPGTAAINLTGNNLAQSIFGNDGKNVLNAGNDAVQDILYGKGGDDTYELGGNSGDKIVDTGGIDTVTSTIGRSINNPTMIAGDIENLVLLGVGHISGTGNAKSNTITGNSGNNTLDAGVDGSFDTLVGNGGDDIYVNVGVHDKIIETSGTDILRSAISVSLGDRRFTGTIENLVLIGNGLTGTGNAAVNRIEGTAGGDTLNGGEDSLQDTLIGFGGADWYVKLGTIDKVIDSAGLDTVTSEHSVSLADARFTGTIENLILLAPGLTGTGNLAGNDIRGTLGSDTLDGGNDSSRDILRGLQGDDIYYIWSSNDVIEDTSNMGNRDVVYSNVSYVLNQNAEIENLWTKNETALTSLNLTGNDTAQFISGNNGSNILNGLDGKDVLQGNRGRDTLTGGTDNDSFLFGYNSSGQTQTACDVITDFTKGAIGVGDEIDFVDGLTVGTALAAATSNRAQINSIGVASFASGNGTTFSDATHDVAAALITAGLSGGRFSLFRVNGAGDYYMFISDGTAGVTAGDVVIQLQGINSIGSTSVAGGDFAILT